MKYYPSSSRWGVKEENGSGDHYHHVHNDITAHNNHVVDPERHSILTTAGVTTKISSNKSHTGRAQLLLSALALCLTGVVHHMKQLPSLASFSLSPSSSSSQPSSGQHQFIHEHLFVPSMDFNILSQVTSENYNNHLHGQYPVDQIWNCTKPAKDLQWEWYHPESSNTTSGTTRTTNNKSKDKKSKNSQSTTTKPKKDKDPPPKPRLLIGLSSGFDKYANMLTLSAHLAKVYAHTHQATVVILQGTALAPDGCTGPTWFSTLNKIRLLFSAIDRRENFDQLLLLEADALMVNMTADIRSLLPFSAPPPSSKSSSSSKNVLLAAQPVRQGDSRKMPERYQIHAGVTLWNLHHPQCTIVALQWFEESRKAVSKGTYWGDERYLQAVLQRQNQDIIQWLENNEFAFDEGTMVKHFFSHASSWSDRKRRMEQVAKSVCDNWDCTVVPKIDYIATP